MQALDIVDWRRHIFALYAEVRAIADPAEAHTTWRRTRDDLFATHPASPIPTGERDAFSGLPLPPYDAAWRFEVGIREAPPSRVELDAGADGSVPFERVGLVDVPGVGSLDVWRLMSYGGGVFVPVKDTSAGTDGGTYGGGRYVLDTVKGADLGGHGSTLVLDFNFAYNPSCAYNPDWVCPLAKPGNVVDVPIPVGEHVRA